MGGTLEQEIEQQENFLRILLGQNPDDIRQGQTLTEQHRPPEVPPGLPSALLERRLDIRQAEEQLIAANGESGVATGGSFSADLTQWYRWISELRVKQFVHRPGGGVELRRSSHSAHVYGRPVPIRSAFGRGPGANSTFSFTNDPFSVRFTVSQTR